MAGPGKKWLLGCGLGCGIPVLLVILVTVGGGFMMTRPFNRAVEAQKELQATYGMRGDFVPTVGAFSVDRLERFITVRQQLVGMCGDFAEFSEAIQQMDELDKNGDEPSRGEIFGAVGNMMSGVFSFAGNIGNFTEQRNKALLAEGMGLGEYIWIYTLTYNSWLGKPANQDLEGGPTGEYSAAEQELIWRMMAHYAVSLASAGQAEEAALWQAEAGHLERTEGSGVPWADSTVPATLSVALAGFEAELNELYCPATSSFEFSSIKKRGMTFTTN